MKHVGFKPDKPGVMSHAGACQASYDLDAYLDLTDVIFSVIACCQYLPYMFVPEDPVIMDIVTWHNGTYYSRMKEDDDLTDNLYSEAFNIDSFIFLPLKSLTYCVCGCVHISRSGRK